MNVIDKSYEEDGELTAPKLRKIVLEKTGMQLSETTLKGERRKLGWVVTNTKYCQLVREANRMKRLEHCQRLVETEETILMM